MRIVTDAELRNCFDGTRRIACAAVVNTDSAELKIPKDQIEKLGLPLFRETEVPLKNGGTKTAQYFGPVWVRVMGRDHVGVPLAVDQGTPMTLGRIALLGLDLMVDSDGRRLLPGHPEFPNEQVYDVF